MGDKSVDLKVRFQSVFLDSAWLVALLAGVWGVLIATEDFIAADCVFTLAGIIFCVKIAFEAQGLGKLKTWMLILVAAVVVSGTIAFDFRWTNRKEAEASDRNIKLSHLNQIPDLQTRLKIMEKAQKDKTAADTVANVKSQQELNDIKEQNKSLQHSVDTKDAALVSIAKDQYALNFFPQIVVSTNGSTDSIFIQNNGKTNVEVVKIMFDGVQNPDSSIVNTIVRNAHSSYSMSDLAKESIVAREEKTGQRVPLTGVLHLRTQDHRRYRMALTWYFEVKEHKIDKSYVVDGPIVSD